MDSLTQIVLGAAVGEATLGKKIGNKAIFYGAIAGTIPDLDVFFGNFTDTITAIEWHRGFSHSIIFCLLFAPIFGWITSRLERKKGLDWKPWTKLYFLGFFTHILLDAFTSWGTQIFWPIKARVALHSIFVIDPLYTVPFLILTITLMFFKRESKTRRRLNTIGLTLSTAYLFATVGIKGIATQKFEQALTNQGISYAKMSTRPAPLNTVLWNANIETKEAYLLADYSFFDSKPIQFKVYPKHRKEAEHLMKYQNVQRLISITEGWYILEEREGEWYFNDLRFGLIPRKDGTEFFTFSFHLSPKNNDVEATEMPRDQRDAKFMMELLWERIQGN